MQNYNTGYPSTVLVVKRVIGLALLLGMALLSACGGSNPSTASSTSSSSSSSSASSSSSSSSSSGGAATAELAAMLTASEVFTLNEGFSFFIDASPSDALASAAGNPGQTLGEQRRIAFKYALGVIASELRITQPIAVEVGGRDFSGCQPWASATYMNSHSGGLMPLPQTLYPIALAKQIQAFGVTGNGGDVSVSINNGFMNGECGGEFFYGITPGAAAEAGPDFIDLILHEMLHGLGFEKRPPGDAEQAVLPFVFERFLWAKDEQAIFAELGFDARRQAEEATDNVVFNGRLTRSLALQTLDFAIELKDMAGQLNVPVIRSDVVGAPALSADGVQGKLAVVAFDDCSMSDDQGGKIVLLAGGCAREELGFEGDRAGMIFAAQAGGAVAVITNATLYERRAAYAGVEIPVATLPLDDYLALAQTALMNPSASFALRKNVMQPAGSDGFGRPVMFTGPDLAELSRLLHFSPQVHPRPVAGKAVRNLMEPVVAASALERVDRSIKSSLPTLIDLGWAASTCGNGVLDTYEECDSGDIQGSASCLQNCLLPGYCGDAVMDPSTEQCDNGAQNNDNSMGACSSICTINK